MRIVASSTATATPSCSPAVQARLHASHDSTIATGLEQVSNFPQFQRPVELAMPSGLLTRAIHPLFMQPPVAAAGMATSVPTATWPVSQWRAATNAQPDTPATHIAPASMPAIREASGLCQRQPAAATASHGVGAMLPCEQPPQTIKALQTWHGMTLEERTRERSLYLFLERLGARLVDTNGDPLVAATVAQFEWLIRAATERAPHGYRIFLVERGSHFSHFVNADGWLRERGAPLFEPILRQAGLDVPPIAESMRAWRKRVRPLIERWCVENPSKPQSLHEFVDEHSPGRTATKTQKMQLIMLEFHLMSRIPDLRQKGQWHETRSALAAAHGFMEATLYSYIKERGALPAGSHLWELLPASQQGQARPVAKRRAGWRDLVRPLVAQWCESSAPGREPLREFVERLLPKASSIRGQGTQLVGLHYYLMKKFPKELGEQSADSLKLKGFAEAQGEKVAVVRRYVLECGRLQRLGEHFELLVPQSLLEQSRDRSVAAGRGPHVVPGRESEAAAAQIPGAPATQSIAARTHAVASDGQLLAPASKRMRMDTEVLQSTAFHAFAPVPASSMWPVQAENALGADAVARMEPILATDRPTVGDDDAINIVSEPGADLADDSLAELDFDWDEIDSRIAAYREQW